MINALTGKVSNRLKKFTSSRTFLFEKVVSAVADTGGSAIDPAKIIRSFVSAASSINVPSVSSLENIACPYIIDTSIPTVYDSQDLEILGTSGSSVQHEYNVTIGLVIFRLSFYELCCDSLKRFLHFSQLIRLR